MEIVLRRGGLTAKAETMGGELVSLQDAQGTEYIWGGDPAFWTGRNPVLFPIVGGLRGGTIHIQGRPFQMGRHGFARWGEFVPVDQGEDYVRFRLQESPETLAQYPYRFALEVEHRLTDQGFTTQFTVEDRDESPLPFCIGAHTAFRCPLLAGERFEDYAIVFDQPETADGLLPDSEGCLVQGRTERFLDGTDTYPLDYQVFGRVDTLIFEGLASKGVTLRHRPTGRGIRLDYDGFPMIAFWTKPGAPYLCMEPWHGCAAFDEREFSEKRHCITLQPGEKISLAYQVTIQNG